MINITSQYKQYIDSISQETIDIHLFRQTFCPAEMAKWNRISEDEASCMCARGHSSLLPVCPRSLKSPACVPAVTQASCLCARGHSSLLPVCPRSLKSLACVPAVTEASCLCVRGHSSLLPVCPRSLKPPACVPAVTQFSSFRQCAGKNNRWIAATLL